mmetsp:Transcript_16752/g.40050  ORF Transcript_16752/g.40050 Transcript_16752/m.40050 type:complete len:151 (+) Transcript_16752:1198-1650(+)
MAMRMAATLMIAWAVLAAKLMIAWAVRAMAMRMAAKLMITWAVRVPLPFEGDWRQRRWHGYGRASFSISNGDSYEGEYKFDQRHGTEVYRWNDGRIYDGQFSEDKRHGKGVLAFPRKASKLSCGAAGNLILLRIRLHVIITIVVATSSVS